MKTLIPFGLSLLMTPCLLAKENINSKPVNNQINYERAADCSAPTGQFDLALNNVRARIYNGGDMWW